jgi:eukaryotic-like serine/threonine-protein kinase
VVPYANLMVIYKNLGQMEKSAKQAEEQLRMEPGSANAYGNLASTYRDLNQFDASKRALDAADAHHFDTDQLVLNRYLLAFLMDDGNELQRIVTAATDKPGQADEIFSTQGDTEAYHGHMTKAREWLRRAVEAAHNNGDNETAAQYYLDSALNEAEVGNVDAARRNVDAGLALATNRDIQLEAALALSRTGEVNRTRALTEGLRKQYPSDTVLSSLWLPTIEASLELQQGNQDRALDLLQPVAPYERSTGIWGAVMYPAYLRGQGYLLAHDPKQAAVEFQKIVDQRGLVVNRMVGAVARLGLGRAYALAGDQKQARRAYQEFMTLWKEADPDVPILKQVMMEYAKLR